MQTTRTRKTKRRTTAQNKLKRRSNKEQEKTRTAKGQEKKTSIILLLLVHSCKEKEKRAHR